MQYVPQTEMTMDDTHDPAALRADLAVMNILRGDASGVDRPIAIAQLTEAWPAYGVRGSDLTPALARLMLRGFVKRDRMQAGEFVASTASGAQWLAAQSAWLEYRLLAPRRERVRFVRAKSTPSSPPRLQRRRGDAPSTRVSA